VNVHRQELAAFHEGGHVCAHHYFSHEIASVEVGSEPRTTLRVGQEVNAFDFITACCAGKAAMDRWQATGQTVMQVGKRKDHAQAGIAPDFSGKIPLES
jgi:hypothetical protein